MLDFHSKNIETKVLWRFTELIYKSNKELSISSFIYKIKVGSKLSKKLMITCDSN